MDINKFTLFSYLSIKEKLLLPLDKFLSNDEIINICKKLQFKNNFFPLPFFLPATENDLKKLNGDKIELFYNKKFFGTVNIKTISSFNKDLVCNLLFKNKKSNHPFKEYLDSCGNYVIETCSLIKGREPKRKRNLIGFATRNIPHKGHEKIIKHFTKRKSKVLINIFENSTNNKKINSDNSFKSYKKFIKLNNLRNKVFLKKIKLPSFLLGPRQAAIHAIVGKNLSCEHYIIGRDHSGYKKFYEENESFKFCKKNEKKLKIKILESGSPVYCKRSNQIVFKKDCNSNDFIDISATLIRNTKNKKLKKTLSNF